MSRTPAVPPVAPRRLAALALPLLAALAPLANASSETLGGFDCVVEPSAVVDLGVAVPGVLAETLPDIGDRVAAGELVARLESRLEEVGVAIASEIATSETAIELRAATSAFGARTSARNARLAAASAVSEQTMDQVRTEARIAALQLDQEKESRVLAALELERARAVLARRAIRSPIEATVVQRFHEAGEYVDTDPVYRVARLDPLHVEVIVPIESRERIAPGRSAAVTLDVPGFEGRPLAATVARIDAVADAASGTYGVRLVLDNPALEIPGGVRCQVDFVGS